MFIKTCITKRKNKEYRYYQIVKSVREEGKVKHQVLANLGYLPEDSIDTLIRGLNKLKKIPANLESAKLTAKKIFSYGDVQVLTNLWQKLDLSSIINQHINEHTKVQFDIASYALLMTIHRLIDPASKLALTRWFMKISFPFIQNLDYTKIIRSLPYLNRVKNFIEKDIFEKQKTLFNLNVDLIFYDITSTYFEGTGPEMAKKGYSRDKRPDRIQILLALAVTQDGLPVGHETFCGNVSDKSTVTSMIKKLKERFNISKCIFIGDRGMVSDDNIKYLQKVGYEYIFALKKRRLRECQDKFESDLGKYTDLITETNDGIQKKLKYFEHSLNNDDIRYIVCHNQEIAFKQIEKIDSRIEKIENELSTILSRFKNGSVILRKACKIKLIDRFYEYGLAQDNSFNFKLKQEAVKFEKTIAGKFILKSDNKTLSAEEIIHAYKNLNLVESAFRDIKGFIEIRPFYHRSDDHVKGHVFICVLSYLLQRVLERYFIKEDGTRITADRILEELSHIKVIENDLNGHTIGTVVESSTEVKDILKKLNMRPFDQTTILSEKSVTLPKKVRQRIEKYSII